MDTEKEQLYDALQDALPAEEWAALVGFNTYCATKCGLTLEVYRTAAGKAAYRFRAMTAAEVREWAEGRVEDQL